MGVRIRIRRGVVHLVIISGGIRREESTGLRLSPVKAQNKRVMEVAEILRSQRELDLVRGLNGIRTEDGRTSLYEYMEAFVKGHPDDSMAGRALPYLERFGGRQVKVSGVTPAWVEAFQEHMKNDSGLGSAGTQMIYCAKVRQMLRLAVRDGLILRNPADGVPQIRKPESRKEFLTAEEVRAMVSTDCPSKFSPDAKDQVRRGFLFGCLTGFRISDILRLTWGDVELEKMVIIRRQKKTGRIVSVPLNAEARGLIDDGKPHGSEERVFPLLASGDTGSRYLKRWAAAAGVRKNVSWHTARHTNATLLLENGAGLYTVQRLLGHTSSKTTMQYAVVSDRLKEEAVGNLPVLGIGVSGILGRPE